MSSRVKRTNEAQTSSAALSSAAASEGFAVARDGSAIFYRQAGSGDAMPIVFCDGIGCDGYVWKYLERELTDGRRIVHWHYRGHGRSPLPRDPRRIDIIDLADDLDVVMSATLGDEPAILVGHSMGVQVCLESYRRHRRRVAGLILMCGSYGTPLRTFKGQRTLEQVLPWVLGAVRMIPGAGSVLGEVMRRTVPTEVAYQIATRFELNGELIRRDDFFPYLEHISRVDPKLFLEMLAAAGRHSAREILDTVEVPTLIVSGERDGFTPARLSDEMHRLIRDSELFVVEGGSHTAPIERPAEVTSRIADFLRKRF